MKKPKTKRQLTRELTKYFNKFIRLRDALKPCISCGHGPPEQAGHYYSTSQYPQPQIRFDEANVHGQCIHCNHFLEGNRQGFRAGIIRRYGRDYLRNLEIKKSIKQNPWTHFEYETMIKYYKKRVSKGSFFDRQNMSLNIIHRFK